MANFDLNFSGQRGWNINGDSMVRIKFGRHMVSGSAWTSGLYACDDADDLNNQTKTGSVFGAPSVNWFQGTSGIYDRLGTTSYCVYELGLAVEEVRVIPTYYHKDVNADGFGDQVPVDLMTGLADALIRMTLVHYSPQVLDLCLAESMGGSIPTYGTYSDSMAGTFPPMGTLLRGDRTVGASGNHFFSINVLSPKAGRPWRFPACVMTERPVEIPLGTDLTMALCHFRAIPVPSWANIDPLSSPTPSVYATYSGQGGVNSGQMFEQSSSGAVLWDSFIDT